MLIVIKASEANKAAILAKGIPDSVRVHWIVMDSSIPDADAYFDLLFEEEGPVFNSITTKPVFVHSVIETTATIPTNAIRLNAWNGFLNRDLLEVAIAEKADQSIKIAAELILQQLGWKFQWVPDIPGMIAARVIAMIINEAYFALEDEVSSKAEIDIAMKLGTNYPFGPFEWSDKIGLDKIFLLLKKMNEQDSRYKPATTLIKEIKV